MIRRLRAIQIVVVALALGGLGGAWAQNRPPAEGTNEKALTLGTASTLSGPEQLAQADIVAKNGEAMRSRIQTMLDEARREKDIIRVTCLNDKLIQVGANLRTLTERRKSLRNAVSADDADRRNHEFTVISVLAQRFGLLGQEAAQCIGQDIFEAGRSQLQTSIDPATPNEDPTLVPDAPDVPAPLIPPPYSPIR